MKLNEHEIEYRSKTAFKCMQDIKICVCGVGALGSNLVNNLVRQGVSNVAVIDMDRVEQKNVSTQIYSLRDVGQKKVNAVKSIVYQANKTIIIAIDKEVKRHNVDKLLKSYDLVIDTFDNWESRKIVKKACERLDLPCVHAGMSDDGFAEVKWNDNYNIPEVEVEQDDICDYPLAANLVQLTSSVLAEVVIQFVVSKTKANREITLKDISIHSL